MRPLSVTAGYMNGSGTRQAGFTLPVVLLSLLAGLVFSLAGSCSSDGNVLESVSTDAALRNGSFVLRVLDDSIMATGDFRLAVSESGNDILVTVSVEQARALKAVYLELDYDAAHYRPQQTESMNLLATCGTPLALTVDRIPGKLYHGEVLADWPDSDGCSADGDIVSIRFVAAVDNPGARPPRVAAAVPDSDQARQYLSYSVIDAQLSWYYSNPGDYDQNGIVGISDLTPLGMHFNEQGPFAESSVQSVVDGDGNDLISISDITPIGTNFGNQVEAYAVYGSADESDYPVGNTSANGPGTRRLATLSLSSSQGGGTARRFWDHSMASPIVGGRYWVRPTAQGAAGTASKLTSPYQQSWHLVPIYNWGPNPNASGESDLAYVNGKPAIVVFTRDGINPVSRIKYFSAADALGEQWNPLVDVQTVSQSSGWESLADINGKPACAWYDDDNGRVLYMMATDPEGQAWDNWVIVYNGYTFMSLLIEHAGKPVTGYRVGSELLLSPALDAQGGTWLPGVSQYGPIGQWNQETAIISLPGGIGTATEDLSTGALQYIFAPVSGTSISPQAPVEVFPGGVGFNLALAIDVADGLPFVATRRSPSNKLYFSYAQDATGASWTTPDITGLSGSATHFNAVGAYGVPWVVYYDEDTGNLHSGHAREPQSGDWVNEANIMEITPAGSNAINWISMVRVGIHPAVCFRYGAADKIMYAVFY